MALSDRLLAAVPVAFSFLVVASLYVWQASRHPTPWLFSDEIEYTQISRAIAETGKPARRGVEYWGAGLFPWLIAPFWWIDHTESAYGAVKTFNSLVMTAAMFPTYLLARMVMARPYALLAAVGSALAPFFIYSAMVMQEPIAYFAAALAFYVTARLLVEATRWNIAAAVGTAVVTPFIRDELIIVPAIMLAALGLRSVWHGRGRAAVGRASWRLRAAYAASALVALVVLVAVARAGATQVEVAMRSPGTMLDQTLWAWGALIVGVGVLPAVIGLAMIVPAASIERTRAVIAFTCVLAASVVLVTAYVAVKGAYQAATFEARVEERNVVYIAPLLFVALALFAATRAIRVWTLALAAALTAWSIQSLPLHLNGLEGDAPGLAILTRIANDHEWTVDQTRRLLYVLVAASVLVGLTPLLLRRRRFVSWIVVGAAVLSIGWATWAETVASKYSNDFADLFLNGLPKPLDWVDQATGGKPAVYIGQKIADPNPIWSLEFWNRDVREVWSLDAPPPGPGPDPDPEPDREGRPPSSATPATDYAVIDKDLSLDGTTVRGPGLMRLVSNIGAAAAAGVLRRSLPGRLDREHDGGVPSVVAHYNLFDAPKKPGTVFVTLSRKGFCGPQELPAHVLIQVGTIALQPQREGSPRAGDAAARLGSRQLRRRTSRSTRQRAVPRQGLRDAAVPAQRALDPATLSAATSARSLAWCSKNDGGAAASLREGPQPLTGNSDQRLWVLADEPGHARADARGCDGRGACGRSRRRRRGGRRQPATFQALPARPHGAVAEVDVLDVVPVARVPPRRSTGTA